MGKRICSGILFLLLAAIAETVCFVTLYESQIDLRLNGEQEMTLEVFSSFSDPGATAEYCIGGVGYRKELEVQTQGSVDTTVKGSYTLRYTAESLGREQTAVRTVHIVDTTAPLLDVEEYTFEFDIKNDPVRPEDVTVKYAATDNYDGDLTDSVTKTVEGGICRLSVSDSSGNTASADIRILYKDGVSPVITLSGQKTIYIKSGGTYVEPGYTATDNLDGDITAGVQLTGLPDMNRSGTYVVTYTVSDSSGNTSYATRKVIVYGAVAAGSYNTVVPNGKTIYLTFDDGPGQYTAELLDILASYKVKATFFVTNQFPAYQALIGRAYSEGHAIGIHTYSHQWSIYSSVESYMADFEAMQNVVRAQTGQDVKIFRFPGGSSNTVSKKYATGIMGMLAEKMTADGYVYFDWNCDSQDTSSNDTSVIANSVINQISSKTTAVVLMHDIKRATVSAVPAILEYGLSHGYTFEVLDTSTPPVHFKINN